MNLSMECGGEASQTSGDTAPPILRPSGVIEHNRDHGIGGAALSFHSAPHSIQVEILAF
jgi:hypothetical protein